MIDQAKELRAVRRWVAFVIFGLFISGVTAFPLLLEMRMVASFLDIPASTSPGQLSGIKHWIALVRDGLEQTHLHYPFLAYGTDWLAFAHLLFAVLFIGPYRDPVKNVWVIDFGILACVSVIPLAMIAGPIRGIPFGWWCLDCSFGLVAIGPLWMCRRAVRRLQKSLEKQERITHSKPVEMTSRD